MKPQQLDNPGCTALIGLPFFLVGVGMAAWSVVDVDDVLEARDWRPVPAQLDHVELHVSHDSDGADTYRADARYHYEVDGTRYAGERVSFHGGSDNLGSYHRDTYRRLHRAWRAGEPITVYVNPGDPSDAIIDRALRVEIVLFRLVFVVVFGGVGGAILLSGVRGRRRARGEREAAARHPGEPWRARPEWETGEIRASSRSLWIAVGLAVLWNAVSWPAFLAAQDALRGGPSAAWVVVLFPLIGIGLAVSAVGHAIRRLRFGVSVLKLRTWPPRLGETLHGEVRTRVRDRARKHFAVRLVNKERIVASPGTPRRAGKWVERYREEVELPFSRALPGQEGWTLPFSFDVPVDQAATDFADGARAWWIEAKAGRGLGHFHAEFEIPVVDLTTSVARPVDDAPTGGRGCPRELHVALGEPAGPWQEEACPSCGGHLLPGDGAGELLQRQGLELATLKRLLDEMGTPSLNCPYCRTRMAQVQVRGQWVDLCGGCGALWLDDGELDALEPG